MGIAKERTTTPRAKKTQLLQELYQEMVKSGIAVEPTHLLETFLTVQDEQFGNRLTRISMDSLDLVKVTIVYHQYTYDQTLNDRRNAIKTARDIFDFYHDLQVGDFSKMSKSLHGKSIPKLSLYYQNSTVNNAVIVTTTMRYQFTEFLFNTGELLKDLNGRLDTFTKAIAEDMQGEGKDLRWEKEVHISKQWWRH